MQSPWSQRYIVELTDVVAFSAKWLIESVYEESKLSAAHRGIRQAFENVHVVQNAFGQQFPDFGAKDLFQRQYLLQSVMRARVFGDTVYEDLDPAVYPARLRSELVNERTEYSYHAWKKYFDKITFALDGLVHFVDKWREQWGSVSPHDRSRTIKYLSQNFCDSFTYFVIQWESTDMQDLNQRTKKQLLPCVSFRKLFNGLELDIPLRDERLFLHFSTTDGTPHHSKLQLKYLVSTGWKDVLKWERGVLQIFDYY